MSGFRVSLSPAPAVMALPQPFGIGAYGHFADLDTAPFDGFMASHCRIGRE
jgi:hypothetical protein